ARVQNVLTPRRIGLCRTPWWAQAETATREALTAVGALFATQTPVEEVDLAEFEEGAFLHSEIMAFEAAQTLARELATPDGLSPVLRQMLERGRQIGRAEHVHNLRRAQELRLRIRALTERYDLLVAPAAVGEAPLGLTATGDPVFSRLWSLLRLPTITLPGFRG